MNASSLITFVQYYVGKEFSDLKEAKIKVHASNFSDIPQLLDQPLGGSRLTIRLPPLTRKKCIPYQVKPQTDAILPLHDLDCNNLDQQVRKPNGTARKSVNWAFPLIDSKNKGITT